VGGKPEVFMDDGGGGVPIDGGAPAPPLLTPPSPLASLEEEPEVGQ